MVATDLQIEFTAFVTPQPQGSMKAFVPKSGKWAGRAVLTSTNKNLKSFRQEVAQSALAQRHLIGFYDVMFGKHVPVSMTMKFYFNRPESAKKRTQHVVRPDLSKLIRATEDALTGIVYNDDSQIVEIKADKFYGLPERVEVIVSTKEAQIPLLVPDDF
jgi:Holliday junction resolvase RusA-like endonuclease